MSSPIAVIASTLPNAMSRRLTGVAKSVAMVPRSFSPATDSAAMDMTLVNTRMTSRSGTTDTMTLPATSRFVGHVVLPAPAFTSKRFDSDDS